MANSETLKIRTKKLAHGCIKAVTNISKTGDVGRVISKQLIRSCTSTAANYRAACLAHSKSAFASKPSIVIEEVDETEYWLTFAVDEKLITPESVTNEIKEAKELLSIFLASRKTIQLNTNK